MSLPAGTPVVLAVACQVTESPNPPKKPNDFVQTISLCLKIQDLPELFLSVSIQEDVSANRRRNCWGKHAVPCRGAAQGEPEPRFPGLQGSGLRGCGGFCHHLQTVEARQELGWQQWERYRLAKKHLDKINLSKHFECTRLCPTPWCWICPWHCAVTVLRAGFLHH